MYNLIFYVYEDDNNLSSSFMWDLKNLVGFSKYKNITSTIIFHSRKIHGDYKYTIVHDKIEMKPIKKIYTSEEFIDDLIKTTQKYYNPSCKNAILFSSHCYKQYIRPFSKNISFSSWIDILKKNNMFFEFILFDGCYMATLGNIIQFYGITKYIIGCQTASPSLGYNSFEMPLIIHKYGHNNTFYMLKKLVDAYISRNDTTPFRATRYRTDGVVLNLDHVPSIIAACKGLTFSRNSRALIEPHPEYTDLFDLWTLVVLNKTATQHQQQKIHESLRKVVIYYKQSKLFQKKYWSKRLHGLSIVLKHKTQKSKSKI
jgi:hypothetical protein